MPAQTHFWALKGGGGGSFGVVSRLTLRARDLPEYAGGADFTVIAASDDAYRRLIRYFVGFYREALFTDQWASKRISLERTSSRSAWSIWGWTRQPKLPPQCDLCHNSQCLAGGVIHSPVTRTFS